NRATGSSQLPILRRRLWWTPSTGKRCAYLPPRRYAICSFERDWKLSPKMASVYFSTTWAWRISRVPHTLKYSNWNPPLEHARSSPRLRATFRQSLGVLAHPPTRSPDHDSACRSLTFTAGDGPSCYHRKICAGTRTYQRVQSGLFILL